MFIGRIAALRGAVGVRHLRSTEGDRLVDRRREVGRGGRIRLHEQDLAIRTDRVHRLDVERNLPRPAGVRRALVAIDWPSDGCEPAAVWEPV